MRLWRWIPLLVVLVLLAAACGDDEAVTTTSVPASTTVSTAVATTTATTLPPAEWGEPWLWLYGGPDGELHKIDGATGELVASVRVAAGWLDGGAVGPGGIWVSECTAGVVHLVSTETAEVVASIPVEGCPTDVAAFAGTVLVLAQDRGAIVEIDPFGFQVIAEYYPGEPEIHLDIEGAANIAEAVVGQGSTWVEAYGAAGNLLVTIQADGPVGAAAVGPGNVVMVVLEDGRVQFFDRSGNLLGRDHVQMSPHSASWADGRFCVVGWEASGQARIVCGDPLKGEPFMGQSAQLGACAATAYGGALYTSSSDGSLAAQTIGDPASYRDLGKVDALVNGLLATPKNPEEGGNGVELCPELQTASTPTALLPAGGSPDVDVAYFRQVLQDYEHRLGLWHALLQAMENPAGVFGWGRPSDPSRPAGPDNPPIVSLGLADPAAPYSAARNPILGRPCSDALSVLPIPRLCPELVTYEQVHGSGAVTADLYAAVAVLLGQRGDAATGFGMPADPSRPADHDNPRQTGLGLLRPSQLWDPQENPLVFKACTQSSDDGDD